jgi:hypothetical protein
MGMPCRRCAYRTARAASLRGGLAGIRQLGSERPPPQTDDVEGLAKGKRAAARRRPKNNVEQSRDPTGKNRV